MTDESTAAAALQQPTLKSDNSAPIVESIPVPKELPFGNYASAEDLKPSVESVPFKELNNAAS